MWSVAAVRIRRAAPAALAAVLALTAGAATLLARPQPAAAHASLSSTEPARDTLVAAVPDEVVLHFDAPVNVELGGGVRVFAADGRQIDLRDGTLTDGNTTLSVGLRNDGGIGTYTVAWKVVSEDSHVLSGSYVFHVVQPTGSGVAVDFGSGDRRGLDVLAWLARWLIVLAVAVIGGVAALRIAMLPRGDTADRGTRRVLIVTALVGLLGAALRMVTQVADASGKPLSGVFGTVSDAVTSTRAGRLDGWRVVLMMLLLATVMLWRQLATTVMALAVVAAIAVVNAIGGHAWTAERRWVAVVADVVHQTAVAVWVGGLVALLLVLRREPDDPAWYARRFSGLALVSVGAIVVSGAVGSWQQLEDVSAATDSVYGRTLVVKLALVAVAVVLGWLNRRRLCEGAERLGAVTANSRAEVGLAVGALALTAALVGMVPGRETADAARAYVHRFEQADGEVKVSVTPGRSGDNTLHVYFVDAAGEPRTVDVATASVETTDVPARSIGLQPVVLGHFAAANFSLPTPGRWTFTVTSSSKGVPSTLQFEVVIR